MFQKIVVEIIWKNAVRPDGPQMTTEHGICAFHAG
jgi:hypothetical protein